MTLVSLALWVADQVPEDDDVVAGWTAFAVFALLIAAVVFLGFSLTKQLRKADAAEEAGLYDPSDKPRQKAPADRAADEPVEEPADEEQA
jgi:HAMP domain-containing protein